MSYDKIIEDCFENLFKLSNKLNEFDSKYLIRNIKTIASYINSFEKRIAKISSYNNKIKEPKYADTLSYYMTLCALHGYIDIELDQEKFEIFAHWFYKNAMESGIYQSDKISKQVLICFYDSFSLFEFTYDRFPDDYMELRKFLFTWEDVVDKKMKDEIKKLTPSYEN